MSSPTRKKPADSGSAGSTPPLADTAESGLLPPEHWSQLPGVSFTIMVVMTDCDKGSYRRYWPRSHGYQLTTFTCSHHVLTLLMNDKLYLAPISDDIQTALDIGTGTGIWAIVTQAHMIQREFADRFPNASVIGTDLAPIQPGWIPPNLEFQIEDCTEEWTLQPNSFDYIHMRWLVGSIADWKALFKEAYKCLKPGGYIESYEPSSRVESDDGTVLPGSALSQWEKFFVEGGRKIGRPFTIFEENIQREGMREAGFVDIEERDFKNPVGGWPKDPKQRSVGQFMQAAFEQDAQGTVLHMATALGWTEEEVIVFISHFRREIRSPKIHSYFRQKVVWGRKPL
ncbi:S-adenosyl-L-methionine-dependent methyltransferase [Fusarium redolens]|uniref:S-adenosyl-L-methionine-dependent methyltransferase n=1 Tax=Fusarium redolens TaxID=48865 RepID=A0A9P9JLA3_FUSRE|nr:S-adenosyl-L-methionine-dependent methyltransferase [Fusarium redolens]KAH7222544.1 S-adenosyl-L-methionine-dependent methyltransferase [Fusarium redolens]